MANIFTFDYVGALLASVVFPLVLMPTIGILRTSYLFGLLNVAVGLVLFVRSADPRGGPHRCRWGRSCSSPASWWPSCSPTVCRPSPRGSPSRP